jgi:hypothetical protein
MIVVWQFSRTAFGDRGASETDLCSRGWHTSPGEIVWRTPTNSIARSAVLTSIRVRSWISTRAKSTRTKRRAGNRGWTRRVARRIRRAGRTERARRNLESYPSSVPCLDVLEGVPRFAVPLCLLPLGELAHASDRATPKGQLSRHLRAADSPRCCLVKSRSGAFDESSVRR